MSHLILIYQLRENPYQIIAGLEASFLRKTEIPADISDEFKSGYINYFTLKEFIYNHPSFKKSCLKISHPHKKYASIIVPVFYDYLLLKNEYSNSMKVVYKMLDNIRFSLVDDNYKMSFKVKKIITMYFNKNLIYNINTLAGLKEYITVMSKMNSFPINFSDSINTFVENYESFKEDFICIMNDLEIFKRDKLNIQHEEYSMVE